MLLNPHEIAAYFPGHKEQSWIDLLAKMCRTFTSSLQRGAAITDTLNDKELQLQIELGVQMQMLELGYQDPKNYEEKSFIEFIADETTN